MNNTIFCVLQDCNKQECHHCFPVTNCSENHEYCNLNGCCKEIKENNNTKIIVTGSCGFIGYHLTKKLLELNYNVIGFDDLNTIIYDSKFKTFNFNILKNFDNYTHYSNIVNNLNIFNSSVDIIIHLAAYANVRISNNRPELFIYNNVEVPCCILNEICKYDKKPYFLYASSSSVYGTNTKIPFEETDSIDNIISPYALTKKTLEGLVNIYCKNYNLSAIGFRFFTVYGPGGRPDMAIYNFITNIMQDKPINMYGDGSTQRDYTYVLDIVDGIYNSTKKFLKKGQHEIYNLGNNKPIKLIELINTCEKITGKKAIINKKPIPIGDVFITYANINKAKKDLNYNPKTSIEDGIKYMYSWLNNINV